MLNSETNPTCATVTASQCDQLALKRFKKKKHDHDDKHDKTNPKIFVFKWLLNIVLLLFLNIDHNILI